MEKQTGIWLDLRNAYLIYLPPLEQMDGKVEVKHLHSHIEENAAGGGVRSKTPWGPQGGDSKRSADERRRHEETEYFHRIIEAIRPRTTEVVIFGPSEAKFGLANALAEIPDYQPKIAGTVAADQMTRRQMTAWVRQFFGRPAPRRLPERY